jgi:hypothetical protein
MKSLVKLIMLLVLGAVLCLPNVAAADTVLYFDNVPGGIVDNEAISLPTDYGGFTWSASGSSAYWGVVDNDSYKSLYSNSFDFPTNPNVVINEDGNIGAAQVMISRATAFTFGGAYFGTWTRNDNVNYYGATSVTITGKLGETEIGTIIIDLSPGPLVWYDIGLEGIDTLVFEATGPVGRYFLMDNFVYTHAPLPPSLLLLGTGILGLVGLRKIKGKIS